ncbi:DUF3099 domain-containing protein [Actinomycetospora lemnae]|uniref:DUF3099 domain-containing protein n=1 Tax=Actinomycetospora lemnae TaxID=3019891 RepID=A0ABT5T2C2_9PSEU|nr:DUF3099 domain-containing protein [Actinomycetospora sp. DW7H6]MDD7969267.1 DUF3099 domain-containing protein [Actinomycetospora sp. DW7H6]
MRRHASSPVLITGAAVSPAEEFAARRRRYSLIMSLRIPCLVVAGVLAIAFGWTIAAAVLVALSVPLPWMAVLIANDGPPRKAEKVATYRSDRVLETRPVRALEAGQVIDMPSDRAA